MNAKMMMLMMVIVASGLSLWGAEACKGPASNRNTSYDRQVVQSCDPNEMVGPAGSARSGT